MKDKQIAARFLSFLQIIALPSTKKEFGNERPAVYKGDRLEITKSYIISTYI